MNKSEEYLDFIEEENKLANEEKMKAYIYKTVGELLEKIISYIWAFLQGYRI